MTLRIGTQSYKGQAQLVPSVGNQDDGFELAVNTALEQIRSTEVGTELLRAIEGADQEVLIVKAGQQNPENTCVQSSQSEQACDAACYREVINTQKLQVKIQELINSKMIQQGHPAIVKFLKFYVSKDYYVDVHKKIPQAHKPKDDRPHIIDDTMKERIWLGDQTKINECNGLVRYLQNGLVAYHIMDYLTRGPGTGAWVVWNPLLEDVGINLPVEKRVAWMNRPPWIALAHELIHGWRLASGRCVFRPSGLSEYYYEEAMTVGLPPYDQCRFTENRFRHLKGQPLRSFYGEATKNQSMRATLKHGSVGSRLKIKVVGSGPNDPLVFEYEIRLAGKSGEVISGKTDGQGHAATQGLSDNSEIRFQGFGAFGRVETQWQKIVPSRYMTLQFGRYRFICEPL